MTSYCDGDVARGCIDGKTFAVDCRETGENCVLTEEGPACRARQCDWALGETRCLGPNLVSCVDGQMEIRSCSDFRATCQKLPGELYAQCVKEKCRETAVARGPELCDGADNDGNGRVDEGTQCQPIDIRAFVLGDRDLGEARAWLRRAVARANTILGGSQDDARLEFVLRDVVRIDAPQWKEVTDKSFPEVLKSKLVHPVADEFYVPVVLVGRLLWQRVPVNGIGTFPGGRCGGHYRDPQLDPALSAIVLSTSAFATLAHELGHFFGLCHTHATDPKLICAAGGRESTALACLKSNDGICDTPRDPGPRLCTATAGCTVTCEDSATPDPRNIMSYYSSCRRNVTLDQHRMMRQALALRRGWHRCVTLGNCACASGESPCPAGMGCRLSPLEGVLKCRFDRPSEF
jgi:hypothetical protein